MNELSVFNGLIPGSASDEDLTRRLASFVRHREAFSPNTWQQLLSVMRICWRWSQANRRSFLPMSPEDLQAYLFHLQAAGRATSTISVHAALISMLHRNAGLVPPTVSPDVVRAKKKIKRTAIISGERTGQAVPFRRPDLDHLDSLWKHSARLQHLRDLAFIHVAYCTLLRMSELSRLRMRDITLTADGRVILDVGWTKTILQSGGIVKALSARSSLRLMEWLRAAGLVDEPEAVLFCPVHRSNKITAVPTVPMSAPSLEDIWRRARRHTGYTSRQETNKGRYSSWSGHSARVGAAQDMAQKGVSIAQIMQEGTWTQTQTVMRYIRMVEAHKGAMVALMEDEA
ncbi:integrase [Pantoea agglomerans]|jgi:integrase|uniref:tyrosine-type recombinase/integrase n=1 Tax=Enterobacter agglomerans TaxID=549 RepID=UPI0013BE712F|nr:tyrosine-type recombinase/integrase [Pantoea agglomerans]MDQ0431001.1 integrase [Pantoea agglomerans]NEG86954.1 tyrosine-type recombinase/integrase [Pantoea agglomerans]NEH06348.1 tyrosine-type recombinase/integrase [Pantoea agglomerans]